MDTAPGGDLDPSAPDKIARTRAQLLVFLNDSTAGEADIQTVIDTGRITRAGSFATILKTVGA